MSFTLPEVKGIYIDMDGVIVDDVEMWQRCHPTIPNLGAHIRKLKVFGQKQAFMYPTVIECIKRNYFETGKPTLFLTVLKDILLPMWKEKGIQVEILSSTMSNNPLSAEIARQKHAWLKANGLGHLPCNLVEGSAKKQEHAKEGWLLIDDYDRTIGQFISKGGYAVQYTNINEVMETLRLIKLAPGINV